MQSAVTFIYKQSKIGSTLSLCRPGGVRTVSQNNTKRFFYIHYLSVSFLKLESIIPTRHTTEVIAV